MPDLYFWSTLKFNLLCSLTTVCLSLLVRSYAQTLSPESVADNSSRSFTLAS